MFPQGGFDTAVRTIKLKGEGKRANKLMTGGPAERPKLQGGTYRKEELLIGQNVTGDL